MVELEELLTPEQVAKMLHMAKSTVYAMAHRGLLPAIKIGRSIRIRPKALAKYLDQQEKRPYGMAA